jgi:hypothetical protein
MDNLGSDDPYDGADLEPGADLYGVNLRGADLSGVDLSDATLSKGNLSQTDLSQADLHRADLYKADLYDANLSGVTFSDANLSKADLSNATLSSANLSGADLSGADLSGADLSDAYFSGADLSGADLSGADLSDAYFSGADLSNADIPDDVSGRSGFLRSSAIRLIDVVATEVRRILSRERVPEDVKRPETNKNHNETVKHQKTPVAEEDHNETVEDTKTPATDKNHIETVEDEKMPVSQENHNELLSQIKHSPSRENLNKYLDLFSLAIDILGVEFSDDRIAPSYRDGGDLRLQVNMRICLGWYPDYHGNGECLGAILPPDSSAIGRLEERTVYEAEYSVRDKEPNPRYFVLPISSEGFFINEFEEEWRRAVLNEFDRGSSVHRARELPALYYAAVDRDYRQRVLNTAYED